VEPRKLRLKYSRFTRNSSILAASLVTIPLLYSFRPAEPFPQIHVKLVNSTDSGITVSCSARFFLSIPISEFDEMDVDRGTLVLHPDQCNTLIADAIQVPPHKEIMVTAEFVNSNRLQETLASGDHFAKYTFYQGDGFPTSVRGVFFTKENIKKMLRVELRPVSEN